MTQNTKMVATTRLLSQKRFFSAKTLHRNHLQWPVKQITKSNYNDSLEEIKHHISTSHFVAISLQNTGSFSSPWHRLSAFDTLHTAYSKAKFAAERFQIFQFAVCPFKIEACKIIARPYNFHLFPRDELKLGMPSYSFTCQTSSLNSMAKEGFDFNACIYEGKIRAFISRDTRLIVFLFLKVILDKVDLLSALLLEVSGL